VDFIDDRSEAVGEKSSVGLEVAIRGASRCGPAVVKFDKVVAGIFHAAVDEAVSHVEDGLFGASVSETADVVDAPGVDSEDRFAVEPSTVVVGNDERRFGNDGDCKKKEEKKFHFLICVFGKSVLHYSIIIRIEKQH